MRNLKRVLSLALALVMVLGMMVITTSAADFTDADEITYTEAVDVMSAIGVIEGNPNTDGTFTFNPEGILTREGAAKLICTLLMGPKNADKLAGTTAFTDVAADRWSAKYIGYCASLGYIAGNGDGTFNPDGEMTVLGFGKLLLCALGYNADTEGYVNNKDWATNVAVDMIDAGLDVRGVEMDAALTRDVAAQMCLQTLEGTLVDYTTKTEVNTGDAIVTISGGRYEVTLGQNGGYNYRDGSNAQGNAGQTVQFCEKYFSDLEKTTTNIEDAFGRPAHVWTYDGVTASFVVKTPVTSFNGATKAADVAKALSGYKLSDGAQTPTVYSINNTTDRTGFVPGTTMDDLLGGTVESITPAGQNKTLAAAIAAITANGKVVELYDVNFDKIIDEIVVIEYKLGEMEDISVGKDKTTYKIDYVSGDVEAVDYVDEDDDDTIALHGTFAEKDVVTFVADNYGVVHVYPTTSIVGAQSAYSAKYNQITVEGVNYDVAEGVWINDGPVSIDTVTNFGTNSTTKVNFYFDQFGYVVDSDAIRTPEKYAVIDEIVWVPGVGVDEDAGYAQARLVFVDGTTEVVTVAEIDDEKLVKQSAGSNGNYPNNTDGTVLETADIGTYNNNAYINQIYTYTINERTGAYELTLKDADSNFQMAKNSPIVDGQVANSATVYVYRTVVNNQAKFTVYTGYTNAPSTGTDVPVSVAVGRDGYAAFVYVDVAGNAMGDVENDVIVFLSSEEWVVLRGNKTYYLYEAAINGVTDIYESLNSMTFNTKTPYEVVIDNDGLIDDVDSDNDFKDQGAPTGYVTATAIDNATKTVLKTNKAFSLNSGSTTTLIFNGNEKIWVINGNGTLTAGTTDDVINGAYIWVKTVDAAGTDVERITVDTMYVIKSGMGAQTLAMTQAFTGKTAAQNSETIKALNDGAYQFDTIPTLNPTIQHTSDPADIMYFKFTTKEAGTTSITLTIKNSAGTAVLTDARTGLNVAANRDGYFYIQVTGSPVHNEGQSGTLLDTALTTGTYTYTIVDNAANTLLSGSFAIN